MGIIGTGAIASAVVEGLAPFGHQITVSERSAHNANRLAAQFSNVQCAANQTVLDQSEVIILGLMAEQAAGILQQLVFHADQKVISLMAGASIGDVAKVVAPAQMQATMLPFPGIAQGGSPILVLGNPALVHTLFGAHNQIFEMASEEELGRYLCAQAVLSPAVALVRDAAQWAGEPEKSERFLRVLVGSSLQASECDPMLAALNTEGGFNQRLRLHMAQAGTKDALIQGLDTLAGETKGA